MSGTERAGRAETGSDVLSRICDQTRARIRHGQRLHPLAELKSRLRDRADTPRGFAAALKRESAAGRHALIAEIKRASPSAGVIRRDFQPASLAAAYEAAGATCLSVLTEEENFHGKTLDLEAAREAVALPVLRKDFILDEWQVYESRAMGADCILLIMAALEGGLALDLARLAASLDLDVLVEVHDEHELERALGLDTKLLGINNRNLKTMTTDLATSLRLAPLVPPDRIIVAESGIRDAGDLDRLEAGGISCSLVGESLLREDDVAAATRRLLGAAP